MPGPYTEGTVCRVTRDAEYRIGFVFVVDPTGSDILVKQVEMDDFISPGDPCRCFMHRDIGKEFTGKINIYCRVGRDVGGDDRMGERVIGEEGQPGYRLDIQVDLSAENIHAADVLFLEHRGSFVAHVDRVAGTYIVHEVMPDGIIDRGCQVQFFKKDQVSAGFVIIQSFGVKRRIGNFKSVTLFPGPAKVIQVGRPETSGNGDVHPVVRIETVLNRKFRIGLEPLMTGNHGILVRNHVLDGV